MRSRHPLSRPFAKRRRALAEQVDAALTGDANAIHLARVASRRLREVLPLVREVVDEDEADDLQQRMKRITRLLGPVREADVTIGLAIEHREALPQEAPAFLLVEAALTHERDERYARVTKDLRAEKVRKWLARAEALERALHDAPDTRAWRVELADRLRTRGEQLLSAVEDAGLLFTSDRLHAVRIAVKRLRYVLELTGELQLARVTGGVQELKASQDVLGHLHDLDVLALHVQAAASERPRNRNARHALDIVSIRLDNERRAAHATYLSHRLRLTHLADWVVDEGAARVESSHERTAAARARKRKRAATASKAAAPGADGDAKATAAKASRAPRRTTTSRAAASQTAATGARAAAGSSASAASAARPTRRRGAAAAPRSARPRPS